MRRLVKIIVGEMVLLIASVLIFRSAWTLLDLYLGYDDLIILLIIGIVLAALSLWLLNYEVKCEIEKRGGKSD
jgi:hypothetical protein